jgi:hypothetical protein
MELLLQPVRKMVMELLRQVQTLIVHDPTIHHTPYTHTPHTHTPCTHTLAGAGVDSTRPAGCSALSLVQMRVGGGSINRRTVLPVLPPLPYTAYWGVDAGMAQTDVGIQLRSPAAGTPYTPTSYPIHSYLLPHTLLHSYPIHSYPIHSIHSYPIHYTL